MNEIVEMIYQWHQSATGQAYFLSLSEERVIYDFDGRRT
jgi:hypothetical protein